MSAREKTGGGRIVMMAMVAVLIALICAANAHLVYVSQASQPECVPHQRIGEGRNSEAFAAASSACSPTMPSQPLRSDL